MEDYLTKSYIGKIAYFLSLARDFAKFFKLTCRFALVQKKEKHLFTTSSFPFASFFFLH